MTGELTTPLYLELFRTFEVYIQRMLFFLTMFMMRSVVVLLNEYKRMMNVLPVCVTDRQTDGRIELFYCSTPNTDDGCFFVFFFPIIIK